MSSGSIMYMHVGTMCLLPKHHIHDAKHGTATKAIVARFSTFEGIPQGSQR